MEKLPEPLLSVKQWPPHATEGQAGGVIKMYTLLHLQVGYITILTILLDQVQMLMFISYLQADFLTHSWEKDTSEGKKTKK